MPHLHHRFILTTVLSNVLLASAWIFFSDRLLTALVNLEEIYWLSTAKGIFFIAITGTFFFFALRAVIQLAAAFNRKVIAEGVEIMDHGKMLIEMGCPQVQCYGIAKPMHADSFPNWCEQWKRNQLWHALNQ